jgi:hypothetical protein
VAHGRSVLVNFVYCPPVGHAIEALHYCYGYHRADPDLRIGLALHADSPTDLATLCPFIGDVYPVAVDVFDPSPDLGSLDAIPTGWDWVVDDDRGHQAPQRVMFPGLAAYYDRAAERFAATGSVLGLAGSPPPRYSPGEQFRLLLPDAARAGARRRLALVTSSAGSGSVAGGGSGAGGGPVIGVLPAGSGPRANYPSVRSWQLVLGALRHRWPEAVFCLLGKLRQDGRTSTSFGRAELAELAELAAALPWCLDAVDLPLTDQLAVVDACDVLVSPHSGFGMAALAVGTPWLSIAGNRWPEYYFNGVPFYSVLPDVRRFPAYTGLGPDPELVDDDGPRAPSMSHSRVEADLDEIIEGSARLIECRWPAETALADHVTRLLALRGGRTDRIWFVDGVHRST